MCIQLFYSESKKACRSHKAKRTLVVDCPLVKTQDRGIGTRRIQVTPGQTLCLCHQIGVVSQNALLWRPGLCRAAVQSAQTSLPSRSHSHSRKAWASKDWSLWHFRPLVWNVPRCLPLRRSSFPEWLSMKHTPMLIAEQTQLQIYKKTIQTSFYAF